MKRSIYFPPRTAQSICKVENPMFLCIRKRSEAEEKTCSLSTYKLQIDFCEAATSRSGNESSSLKLNQTYRSKTCSIVKNNKIHNPFSSFRINGTLKIKNPHLLHKILYLAQKDSIFLAHMLIHVPLITTQRRRKMCYLVKGFKFLEFCWCSGNLNSVFFKYLSEIHNASLREFLSKLMH